MLNLTSLVQDYKTFLNLSMHIIYTYTFLDKNLCFCWKSSQVGIGFFLFQFFFQSKYIDAFDRLLLVADYPLPEALLPECLISESGKNYRGTQWVTEDGIPCMPWNVSSVQKVWIYIFTNTSTNRHHGFRSDARWRPLFKSFVKTMYEWRFSPTSWTSRKSYIVVSDNCRVPEKS